MDEPLAKGLRTAWKICASLWDPQTHLHPTVLEAVRDCSGMECSCFVSKHTHKVNTAPDVTDETTFT